MAFVRKRGNSHQLIEGYRADGTVKQRIIANLGPYASVEAAVAAEPETFGHLVDGPKPVVSSVVSRPVVPPKPLKRLTDAEVKLLGPEEGKRYRAAERLDDAAKRREVLAALAPVVKLASLINRPKKRELIDEVFVTGEGEDELPAGISKADLVKALRLLIGWLPDMLSNVGGNPGGKPLSREARWHQGASDALSGLGVMQDIKQDFASWRSTMPAHLADAQQTLVERLDAFENVDVDSVVAEVEALDTAIDEWPLGYGRD